MDATGEGGSNGACLSGGREFRPSIRRLRRLLRVRRSGGLRGARRVFDRHSGESRNPFLRLCLWPFAWTSSLQSGEDRTPPYIRFIRSGFGHGALSRESDSNAKTKAKIIKWIPAFAGMTVRNLDCRGRSRTWGVDERPTPEERALHEAPLRVSFCCFDWQGGTPQPPSQGLLKKPTDRVKAPPPTPPCQGQNRPKREVLRTNVFLVNGLCKRSFLTRV